MAVGDFNGDGKLDLATANGEAFNISVLLGNGDGTFQNAKKFDAIDPNSLAVGDFNADGKLDLAFTTGAQPGVLWETATAPSRTPCTLRGGPNLFR